jgi:membrane protein YqaA with SNARE-associated domain
MITAHNNQHQRYIMLRRIYDRTMALADHPYALWWLALVAFVESSVFPIPPDVMIIPMVLARPDRAWRIALVATVASVAGGLLGYGIGALFYDTMGRPMLEALGKADSMDAFNAQFNDYSFLAVLTAGLTPFPYKVITIMSGWTGMPILTFLVTSILARSIRFFIVAGLLRAFGAPIKTFIEERLGLVFTAFIVLLVGSFFLLRYL